MMSALFALNFLKIVKVRVQPDSPSSHTQFESSQTLLPARPSSSPARLSFQPDPVLFTVIVEYALENQKKKIFKIVKPFLLTFNYTVGQTFSV